MDEYGFGSRGPGVQLLQLGLSRAGYQPGRIDGSFGKGTENALRQFQQAQGLPATGRSDAATWQAMMPWLIGTRFVQLRQGDTFWRLSQQYDTSVAAISAANPELDPRDLRPGQTVAIPLDFPVVPTGIAFTSQVLELTLTGLLLRYPYLGSGAIGSSARGLPIWSVSIGEGETQVFYNAAHHANEWITTPVLLAFLEEYCLALLDGDTLYGYDAAELFRRTTLSIVPMVDPDGVDLVTGYLSSGPWYECAKQWAENYPSIPFPEGWKANLNGVDLNLQYPAGWEEARRIKESMGFTPAPRDYVGTAPLTQPEALAVYRHTLRNDFRLTLSYHAQGKLIYWRYLDYLPPRSEEIAQAMGEASGYSVEELPPSAATRATRIGSSRPTIAPAIPSRWDRAPAPCPSPSSMRSTPITSAFSSSAWPSPPSRRSPRRRASPFSPPCAAACGGDERGMACRCLSADGREMVYSRLPAGKIHRRVTICTPAGGALLFCEEK